MYRSRWLDAAGRLLSIAGTATLLSSPASAEVQFEGSLPSELEMETSYTVRWSTDADNVKITMVSGSESGNNIYHLYDLVCNIWLVNNLSNACTTSETSLDWKPPDDLPIGHYMLMATAADDSDAFSNQFNLVEAGDASSTGGSSGGSSEGSTITSAPGSTASLITSVFTSSSAGSAQVITSVITQAPGATGTSDVEPESGGGGGLSTGAKAGIGVGAAIGALILLGGLGFAFFRMGKRSVDHDKKDDAAGDGKTEEDKGKEGEDGAGDAKNLADAEAGGVAELQAPVKIHEAPDYKTRLGTPGKKEFVSELDATGGSFVIPQTSRPATSAGAAAAESADKAGEPKGDEETAKKVEDGPSTPVADERTSTSSGRPKSVRYETPDDIGRQPGQQ